MINKTRKIGLKSNACVRRKRGGSERAECEERRGSEERPRGGKNSTIAALDQIDPLFCDYKR